MNLLDDIFLIVYIVECLLKIIGMGFFFGRGSYLSVNWNKLDFLIVITSVISYF